MFITLFAATLFASSANAEETVLLELGPDRECQLMGVGPNQPAIEKLCRDLKATRAELTTACGWIYDLEKEATRTRELNAVLISRIEALEEAAKKK